MVCNHLVGNDYVFSVTGKGRLSLAIIIGEANVRWGAEIQEKSDPEGVSIHLVKSHDAFSWGCR